MILLTSSVASVAGHLYKKFLAEKKYHSILFIDTAAEIEIGKEAGDDDWLQADLQSLRDQGYEVNRYTVTGKKQQEIESVLNSHDIIYMCGGNTLYLLKQLQTTGSFDLIKEKVLSGKPYIGTSAGSIIAGPKVPLYLEFADNITVMDDSGFGFINVIVVPHWGSVHFKDLYLERGLQAAYHATEPPLLLLNDGQYIALDGTTMEIINTYV
jgi:dipeptidase E